MTLTFRVLIGVVLILVAGFFLVTKTDAYVEPQVVHVNLTDTEFQLSQFVVAADRPVTFEVSNQGTISHNIVIRPMTDSISDSEVGLVVGAHTIQAIKQTLKPGIYRIYCSFFDHADKGMQAAIAAQLSPRPNDRASMTGIVSMVVMAMGCVYLFADGLGIRLIHSEK